MGLFRNMLLLLLTTAIFVSGSGIVVGKMICLKSGRELIKLGGAPQCCCPDTDEQAAFEHNCCLYDTYSVDTDNYIQSSPLSFQFLAPAILPVFAFGAESLSVLTEKAPVHICSKPPPLTGKFRLQFHQSFLI